MQKNNEKGMVSITSNQVSAVSTATHVDISILGLLEPSLMSSLFLLSRVASSSIWSLVSSEKLILVIFNNSPRVTLPSNFFVILFEF